MFMCLNGILQNEEKLKMPNHLLNQHQNHGVSDLYTNIVNQLLVWDKKKNPNHLITALIGFKFK